MKRSECFFRRRKGSEKMFKVDGKQFVMLFLSWMWPTGHRINITASSRQRDEYLLHEKGFRSTPDTRGRSTVGHFVWEWGEKEANWKITSSGETKCPWAASRGRNTLACTKKQINSTTLNMLICLTTSIKTELTQRLTGRRDSAVKKDHQQAATHV